MAQIGHWRQAVRAANRRRATTNGSRNVFVLCTGRCGSMTWIKACRSIANYSSAHESRMAVVGDQRLAYPPNHIEADNRLSWMLGRLDDKYGDSPMYVHLLRDNRAVAESYAKRWDQGIIRAYRSDIIFAPVYADRLEMCLDYCETVNRNIEMFLRDKSRVLRANLETVERDFTRFWQAIGATGDLAAAMRTLRVRHNAS